MSSSCPLAGSVATTGVPSNLSIDHIGGAPVRVAPTAVRYSAERRVTSTIEHEKEPAKPSGSSAIDSQTAF